jgi:hypothetical protein
MVSYRKVQASVVVEVCGYNGTGTNSRGEARLAKNVYLCRCMHNTDCKRDGQEEEENGLEQPSRTHGGHDCSCILAMLYGETI